MRDQGENSGGNPSWNPGKGLIELHCEGAEGQKKRQSKFSDVRSKALPRHFLEIGQIDFYTADRDKHVFRK